MQHLEEVKNILATVLGLGERKQSLGKDTPLLGSMPELDSMAAVSLIAALEDHFGFAVHDDEISAATFSTVGSLSSFVDQKLGG